MITNSEYNVRGDITVTENPSVAVIGRRDATEEERQISFNVGRKLAQNGYAVINGLALGCDAAALEGAFSVGGKTLAVLPSGFNNITPKTNISLLTKIISSGGCAISEFNDNQAPNIRTYIKRDETIAEIADVVIVVSANEKGGTWHTIKSAKKAGKPVAFVNNRHISGEGNKRLLNDPYVIKISNTTELLSFCRYTYAQQTLNLRQAIND